MQDNVCIHSPKWLDSAVFYEIYPQSFQDSNADGIGDIPGIIQRLDYIHNLGCNALWINPCFDSPFKDGGYDVRDYTMVAPRYGTNDDLVALFDEAHKRGMRFDGWADCFDFDAWMQVFKDLGIDPAFYANRQRSFDEVFPWDHLDYGIKKEFLIEECKRAYASETTPNCREKCSACGAACFKGGLCIEKRC